MQTYARVLDGIVYELFSTDGNIIEMFPPQIIWADVTNTFPQPEFGWSAVNLSGAWQFSPPEVAQPNNVELAAAARQIRETLLRGIYDPGINMALRAIRMAATPEEIAYAEGKVAELDSYAEALQNVPEQVGFPQNIVWPVAPTQ